MATAVFRLLWLFVLLAFVGALATGALRFDWLDRAPVVVAGDTLYLRGGISRDPTWAEDVAAALRDPDLRQVVISSAGGSGGDAAELGRLIRARGLETRVPAFTYCASACVILFMGGAERSVGRFSRLGVHRFGSYADSPIPPEAVPYIERAMTAYFAEMGARPELARLMLATPHETMHWLTREELRALDVVTTG